MFTDAPGESLTINSVEIIEDCLLLNYSAEVVVEMIGKLPLLMPELY